MDNVYRIKSIKEQVTETVNSVISNYVLMCWDEDVELYAIYKEDNDCWYVQYFGTAPCTSEEEWFKLTNEQLIEFILSEELMEQFAIVHADEWLEKGYVDHIIKPSNETEKYTMENIDETPNNSLIVIYHEIVSDYAFYIKIDDTYYCVNNAEEVVFVDHSLNDLNPEYHTIKAVIPLNELKKYNNWSVEMGFYKYRSDDI